MLKITYSSKWQSTSESWGLQVQVLLRYNMLRSWRDTLVGELFFETVLFTHTLVVEETDVLEGSNPLPGQSILTKTISECRAVW